MVIRRLFLVMAILLFPSPALSQIQNNEADEAAVLAAVARVAEAFKTSNAQLLLDQVADDASFMLPEVQTIHGKENLVPLYTRVMENTIYRLLDPLDEMVEDVMIQGDLAVVRLTFHGASRRKAGGEEREFTNRVINVYVRQADGSWKLRWDIGVPDASGS